MEELMQVSLIPIAEYTLIVTGILVAIGGIIGFIKAKSLPSLISGVVSGILLVACFFVASQYDPKYGLPAGIGVLTMLEVVFAIRFAKTKKVMPSLVLIAVCGIAEVIAIFGTLQAFGVI
jgi:uncharacterized membrane protein (UPF0136 family)